MNKGFCNPLSQKPLLGFITRLSSYQDVHICQWFVGAVFHFHDDSSRFKCMSRMPLSYGDVYGNGLAIRRDNDGVGADAFKVIV